MNTFLYSLRLLAFGCVGAVLSAIGYSILDWEFWAIILCMAIVQLTSCLVK